MPGGWSKSKVKKAAPTLHTQINNKSEGRQTVADWQSVGVWHLLVPLDQSTQHRANTARQQQKTESKAIKKQQLVKEHALRVVEKKQ